MKIKKLMLVFAVLAMLLSGFSSPVKADWSKVDQRVLDQIDANGAIRFHVVMAAQADLSGAAALHTKLEKTTYVFNLLTRTAAQTQAPLLAQMKVEGVSFRSYYIYNMIEVTAGRSTVAWLASRPEVSRIIMPPNPQKEPVHHDLLEGSFGPLPAAQVKAGLDQGGEGIEWNVTRIGAPGVWDMGIHGEGMVVAGNDTGVDYTHPALVGKYRGNLGGGNFDHDYNWWGGAGSPAPVDGDGHGTHTMGTMVGDDGGDNQIGVAPGSQWIACAGLGGADTVECFEFFLAPWDLTHSNPDPSKAPDSINNSWYDTSGYDYRPIIQALNAAGVAVVKSAGNWGSACSTISPPGNVPEIIATAAFAQGDVIADFSSRGPDSTYGQTILKPEVAAPGVNVRSSVPGGGYEGGWSGTSMAAPHSTALVALMWSAAPCLQGDVPTTKTIMMETAEAKVDAQCPPFVDHPNDVWGWGILDAVAAVDFAIGYCGGLGTLQGSVTDASTTLPLESAAVKAEGTAGYSKTDLTDVAGFYTMNIPADTYTVTARIYGYEDAEVPGVVVTADVTTTQDLALTPLPIYTVSGYVRDSSTNAPLPNARVEFTDAPVAPVYTDPAGFYTIDVAEGTWTMKASADLHSSQEVVVVVAGNTSQDFLLDPLPCILLVDDDQNGPDVRAAYTSALDDLAYGYNVWDVSAQGDPAAANLTGYNHVLWFTGYPWTGTFTGANEAAVGAYLDAGGNFFLSGQDYLYEFGNTAFGQNYLHIASFTSDVNQTTVTGQNVFAGLGPYSLSYPFTNYSDVVNPDAQAQVAFMGNVGNAAVSFDGASFRTAFFGYPFEALPNLAARSTVMGALVEHFGGCVAPWAVSITPPTDTRTGDPGTQVVYSYSVTNLGPAAQDVNLSVSGNDWTTVVPATTGVLDSGASATVPVTVTIPTALGSKYDTFTLNASGFEGGAASATGATAADVNPAVDMLAPAGGLGAPSRLVSNEFVVTNTGDYTDSFTLEVSGIWPVSLPGGGSTGPLAPGASAVVVVLVEVPESATPLETDTTTLTATSTLDPEVFISKDVTTTAAYVSILPIVAR